MKNETQVQHTPGPWVAVPESEQEYARVDAGEYEVASVCGNGVAERDANARLIAAAPDLLAAAQRMARALEQGRYPELQGVASDLFAAIAKAEGCAL